MHPLFPLFLKNDNPIELNEYKSISLVCYIYKIISKVLTNKLKGVLLDIIDQAQSTFIKWKSLLDSILVADEIVEEVE